MEAESLEKRSGFKARFRTALRPRQSPNTLRKNAPSSAAAGGGGGKRSAAPPAPLAPLQAHRERYKESTAAVDSQLGERRDHTELLHAIGKVDDFDLEEPPAPEEADLRPPGEQLVASLSPELWRMILDYLDPIEATHLALSSRTLYRRMGSRPWEVLNRRENYRYKIDFLITLDQHLPRHLLCFPCASYHVRTKPGTERLEPASVLNPLFNCPNARNIGNPPARLRIAPGRLLPFAFVQLAMRAHKFSAAHGMPTESLSRRWKRDGWAHETRYHIHQGHLLMRVVSSAFAPLLMTASETRQLLYSARDDFRPHFSACAHWQATNLFALCRCALSHVPQPRATDGLQGAQHRLRDQLAGREYNPNPLATLCADCRPMRRCPACPTEYLLEVKLAEDRADPRRIRFRYALVVSRWSDLGDGSSPMAPEWAACNGQPQRQQQQQQQGVETQEDGKFVKGGGEGAAQHYDSFAALGKRAVSGIFEAAFTHDAIPGQRILALQPRSRGYSFAAAAAAAAAAPRGVVVVQDGDGGDIGEGDIGDTGDGDGEGKS